MVGQYGALPGEAVEVQEVSQRRSMGAARYVAVAAAGCAIVLLAVSTRLGGAPSELSQTSMNSIQAHPYGSMHLAPWEVSEINPDGRTTKPVNAAPVHPYHVGLRPRMVLNRDFEHQPYGNKLPWETGPEGAVAKTVRRSDKLTNFRYMVNKDGVVRQWQQKIPLDDVGSSISDEALRHLSPMPEPSADARDVAQALLKRQLVDVRTSFRSIYPDGMFRDSLIDSRTGHSMTIPSAHAPPVECLAGLIKCPDNSCKAHVSYCPGCDKTPAPSHCMAVASSPSGWSPSAVGCDVHDLSKCDMAEGNALYMPGEASTGGFFSSGLP